MSEIKATKEVNYIAIMEAINHVRECHTHLISLYIDAGGPADPSDDTPDEVRDNTLACLLQTGAKQLNNIANDLDVKINNLRELLLG